MFFLWDEGSVDYGFKKWAKVEKNMRKTIKRPHITAQVTFLLHLNSTNHLSVHIHHMCPFLCVPFVFVGIS